VSAAGTPPAGGSPETETPVGGFRVTAHALHADGRSGDAFAEVAERSLADCLARVAAEVADWLPGALAGEGVAGVPVAVELTLEWDGEGAPAPSPSSPGAAGHGTRRILAPRGRRVLCVARRRTCPPPSRPLAAPAAAIGWPA
jgi:hypothetical protein